MNSLKSPQGIAVAAIAALLVIAVGGWFLVHESGGSHSSGGSSNHTGTAPASSAPTSPGTSHPTSASPSSSAPASTGSTSASPIPSHPTLSGPTIATASPIGLQDRATLTNGGTARVTRIESVTSKAALPGELSRPALRVTVTMTAGARTIALSNVVVNAYYGRDLTPAVTVSRPGGKPFSGTLKAHASAKGVYIFNVPKSARGDVRIEVAYAAASPTAIFEGPVS